MAAAIGAIFKLGETGCAFGAVLSKGRLSQGGSILYVGTNLSPALIGVGYIVGLNIAVLIFIGGAINWYLAVPILAMIEGIPPGATAVDGGQHAVVNPNALHRRGLDGHWRTVGTDQIAAQPDRRHSSPESKHTEQKRQGVTVERTERDIPMQWIGHCPCGFRSFPCI